MLRSNLTTIAIAFAILILVSMLINAFTAGAGILAGPLQILLVYLAGILTGLIGIPIYALLKSKRARQAGRSAASALLKDETPKPVSAPTPIVVRARRPRPIKINLDKLQ